MSADAWDQEYLTVIKSEHEELTNALMEVRDALSAANRNRNHFKDLITRLDDLVAAHFAREERGGYFRDVVRRAPRYAEQAAVLLDQHDMLLEELEMLRLLVHSGVESSAWWNRIEADFHKIAARLIEHEAAEGDVVQRACAADGEAGE